MSNEIKTTTSTAAGVMERLQADLTAGFLVSSRLFPAVWQEQADNANVVQFYSVPAPTIRAAATEADDWTANAYTMTAKAATLTAYPAATKVSMLAMQGGQFVRPQLIEAMYSDVALSVDKIICDQIADFTPTISGASMTATVFNQGLAALRNQGWSYPVAYAILTERQSLDLLASLGTTYIPSKNDQMWSTGYVGNILGVEVFTVPSGIVPTTGADGYGCIYYPNVGLGLGYNPNENGGLIHVQMIEDLGAWKISAAAYCAATELSATGGVKIKTTTF